MYNLPVEILEKILSYLSLEDAVNFCEVNSMCEPIRQSDGFWTNKFFKRFPSLSKEESDDWYEEIVYFINLIPRVQDILIDMLPKYCCYGDMRDRELGVWSNILNERPKAYKVLVAILREIINNNALLQKPKKYVPQSLLECDKTWKYISVKALSHLNKVEVMREIREYLSLPEERKMLDRGIAFIAKWAQPHLAISWERDVDGCINTIVQKVKHNLQLNSPGHSIFKKSDEELESWRTQNLSGNQFDSVECNEIIACVKHVLVNDLKLKEVREDNQAFNGQFINMVLKQKKGFRSLIVVIYESVMRRLGIRMQIIFTSENYTLRYKEGRSPHGTVYMFHNFTDFRMMSLPNSFMDYPVATIDSMLLRYSETLYRSVTSSDDPPFGLTQLSCLELIVSLCPNDVYSVLKLARHYMSSNMDTVLICDHITHATPRSIHEKTMLENILIKLTIHQEKLRKVVDRDPTHFGKICAYHLIQREPSPCRFVIPKRARPILPRDL